MKFLLILMWAGAWVAQDGETEEDHLGRLLGTTNGSPTEVVRVLEVHLAKYPTTARRGEIERALFKTAVDLKDERRIILYGEKILKEDPNELQTLDRVTASLLSKNITPERAERALAYARRFEEVVRKIAAEPLTNPKDAARKKDEVERGIARALMNQARALGTLGKLDEAVAAARRSWERHAGEPNAHELGMWLMKAGQHAEAAAAFIDAFTVPDSRSGDTEREANRRLAAENWKKAKGSEAGLGEAVLAAFDRNVAAVAARRKALRELDPNRDVADPSEFTVTSLTGGKLKLASLRGKVVVLDFWATWCQPCRGQYPLYEEVRQKYKGRDEVVFLAINTDEDPSVVKPFLDTNQWNKAVYFEDGLARAMSVTSIPTTVIFGRDGQVVSRMNGYVPEKFVAMLTERIEEALGK
jgi:thiol-disulfide isomerase/thioredoxin